MKIKPQRPGLDNTKASHHHKQRKLMFQVETPLSETFILYALPQMWPGMPEDGKHFLYLHFQHRQWISAPSWISAPLVTFSMIIFKNTYSVIKIAPILTPNVKNFTIQLAKCKADVSALTGNTFQQADRPSITFALAMLMAAPCCTNWPFKWCHNSTAMATASHSTTAANLHLPS